MGGLTEGYFHFYLEGFYACYKSGGNPLLG